MAQTLDIAAPCPASAPTGSLAALLDLLGETPAARTVPAANPVSAALPVISVAALKAAAISGGAAAVPGIAGLLTVAPDLVGVWKVQQQMVADIAGLFGKEASLCPEVMLACLFRHSAAQLARDVAVRAGERCLARKASVTAIQAVLKKLGIRVTQKAVSRGMARFLPVAGSVLVASYAAYDTRQVGMTAVGLFGSPLASEAAR